MSDNKNCLGDIMFSQEDLLEITIYYSIQKNKNKKFVKVLNDQDEEKKDTFKDLQILNTKWRNPTWKTENNIMTACQQVDPITGSFKLDLIKYRDQRIKMLLVDWDLEYNGNKMPVSSEYIDKLPPEIVLRLFEKYDKLNVIDENNMGK